MTEALLATHNGAMDEILASIGAGNSASVWHVLDYVDHLRTAYAAHVADWEDYRHEQWELEQECEVEQSEEFTAMTGLRW